MAILTAGAIGITSSALSSAEDAYDNDKYITKHDYGYEWSRSYQGDLYKENDEKVPEIFVFYVNNQFYSEVIMIKTIFDNYYGSKMFNVSSILENNNNKFSEEDVNLISNDLKQIYINVCRYIRFFRKKEYALCYTSARSLLDCYSNFSQRMLLNLLIGRQIDKYYDSSVYYSKNDDKHYLNNNAIKLIGNDFDLLISWDNSKNDAIDHLEWLKRVPSIINSHYSIIEDTTLKDSKTYYLWNDSIIKNILIKEVQDIKREGALVYNFIPEKTNIIWIDGISSYAFIDENNNVFGTLSSLQGERYENVLLVQNTFISLKGDVQNLDLIIREMQNINNKEVLKSQKR